MAEKTLGDGSPRGFALRWHRELCRITGGLSIAIGRSLSRANLKVWAAALREVADQMEKMADGNGERDNSCGAER